MLGPKGRKRQRGLDATFYVAPDSPPHDNELPLSKPPIVQRHTTYNSTGDSMSSARSYYNMPVSPQKVSEAALTLAKDGDVFENAGSHNNRLYPHTEIDNGTLPHDWMDPNHIPSCSEGTTDISTDISGQQVKRARTVATDHPLHIWTLEINVFVHELLRLEGLGGQDATTCSRCSGYAAPVYHCSDCLGVGLQCSSCIVCAHSCQPFHEIQEWTGEYFRKASLMLLGLRVQLGHVHGESCLNPLPASKSGFVVIDTEKIHTISLDFCNCHVAMDRHIQLLRARLYPATTISPQTAATFRVLEGFQLLSFMSKVSAFEFYYTIARRTDNTGVSEIPDRYSAFLRMIREWRHIKTLKRMGRGHDPRGVKATKAGECAVMCPACPHPGKNLPPDWKDAPAGRSWLYTLFVGIDANFRLSRFNVSSNEHDPGLNHGYAFFVEDKKFKAHLKAYGDIIIDEVSTCNNHDAVKSASLRGGKGIDASGAGTVECSRHDMKRPISFGDLQKGERHVNIDYLFLNTLTQNVPHRIVVSYDVACIWSPNLLARSQIYPPNLIPFTNLIYVVPKFHLPAHISKCQANFSLNFTPLVGRTDGEAPERGWAAMNAVATSTREMGPGSRRDTLDDHFGDYNWRKITSMVTTFHNKFKEAVNHRSKSVAEFQAFSASLPPDETAAWTLLIQAWEKDPSQTNPLEATLRDITVPKVRLQLAEDDAKRLQDNSSGASVIHTELSPSMLIIQGIEIEDLQHSLRQDTAALSLHPTSLQKAKLLERNNRLQRRIDAWISFQQLYTPGVAALRRQRDQQGEGGDRILPMDIDLLMPSRTIGLVDCDVTILGHEWKLRRAQAHDLLHEIRHLLLLRTRMYTSKDRFSRGQKQQTQSVTLLKNVKSRIDHNATKYRDVRDRVSSLSQKLGIVGWDAVLRPLEDSDLRGLAKETRTGEGSVSLSWIWLVVNPDGKNDFEAEGGKEGLRIEWCKARARAHRWQEECLLLQEEMRRIKAYFQWQADWWMRLGNSASSDDPTVTEGMVAYTHRQRHIRLDMLALCTMSWKDLEEYSSLGQGLPIEDVFLTECH